MERLRSMSQDMKALSVGMREEMFDELDRRVRLLNLCEGPRVRKAIDLYFWNIRVQSIPEYLGKDERAILVSNYFSVTRTIPAILKVGCRLPGEEMRLRAIARKEIKTEAGLLLKALGVDRVVYSAYKDETGVYKLGKEALREIGIFLEKPGHVLWLSVTGKTKGNGLLEGDLRTGAAALSSKKQVPIVPMGIATKESKGKRRIKEIRFGQPILVPETEGLDKIDETNLLIDCTRLAMCRIAELLPPGQRGDFEKAEEISKEIEKRLESY